jgi:di/tricarboxylate transporter
MLIPMNGLSYPGHAAIALLVFAVIMWATETVHLAVTSLIILFIQPIIGVESFNNAVIGFANPIIFLMIGGFIMAEAIRKSGLATRMTYAMLNKLVPAQIEVYLWRCFLQEFYLPGLKTWWHLQCYSPSSKKSFHKWA